jgi:hypothetical protein
MRLTLMIVLGIAAAMAAGTRGSVAQSAASHPFCALDSSSGATSCYYDSRAACGPRCISNPAYAGSEDAMARAPGAYRAPRRR